MTNFLLYIDPGTGSMLFSLFIGLATTAVFGLRALIIKVKSIIGRGKQTELDKSHLGIVIYSDSKRYWNVFSPIVHEFENRKIPLVYYTQSSDDPALSEKFQFVKTEFIGEGNRGLAKMNMLNADVCLATTPGLDVLQWKRSRQCKKYVHIFHAVDEALGYRMFGMDHFDSVLLTGEFQGENIRKLEKLRNLPQKELKVTGSTYLDAMKARLEKEGSGEKSEKIVLLAPSWGESAILKRYGKKIISSLVETGYKIIIRPHPQSMVSEKEMMEKLMLAFPNSSRLEWNFDNDNFDVLKKSDILITDFSGIIFDYTLVFDRPLIYADTSFDDSPYDASWIEDEPLWRFEALKKLGVKLEEKDFPNIKQIIDSTIESTEFSNGRKEISLQAWQNKGKCASSTVDYLLEVQKAVLISLKYMILLLFFLLEVYNPLFVP